MDIAIPILIVNFKTYAEATGLNALNLSSAIKRASEEIEANVAIAPQFADIYRVSSETNLPVLAQHVDAIGFGSHTGHILPESVKEAGAIGSLVNHSERKLKISEIAKIVNKLRELDMISVVCADDVEVARAVAALNPDFVAVEPPELIGTGIPVSKAKPEVVRNTVEEVKKINPEVKVLCGAGITNRDDVVKALELGTDGVLLASGLVKAKDPYSKAKELLEGLKEVCKR